jgi:hypothetical protein
MASIIILLGICSKNWIVLVQNQKGGLVFVWERAAWKMDFDVSKSSYFTGSKVGKVR